MAGKITVYLSCVEKVVILIAFKKLTMQASVEALHEVSNILPNVAERVEFRNGENAPYNKVDGGEEDESVRRMKPGG